MSLAIEYFNFTGEGVLTLVDPSKLATDPHVEYRNTDGKWVNKTNPDKSPVKFMRKAMTVMVDGGPALVMRVAYSVVTSNPDDVEWDFYNALIPLPGTK